MADYIEENLTEDIDFATLGKIAQTNTFILERIFVFLTDMTLTEYIKRRRLSKAFEEIKNTDKNILEIALKYGYNSSSAFTRAFKNLFGMNPTECRKKDTHYKIIPKVYFKKGNFCSSLDYSISKVDSKDLYCYHTSARKHSELIYKIQELYKKVQSNGHYEKFGEYGMYGIFEKNEDSFDYYLGSTHFDDSLIKYVVPSGNYAVFTLASREQDDIIEIGSIINENWIPSTNYKSTKKLKIELYEKDMCSIFIPINILDKTDI